MLGFICPDIHCPWPMQWGRAEGATGESSQGNWGAILISLILVAGEFIG